MGACASVAKHLKAEDARAPPPEAPKEETACEIKEVKPQQEEKKPEVADGEKVVDDKPSLGALLSEGNEVKKETTTNEKAAQTEVKVPSSEPVEKEEPPKAKEEEEEEEKEKTETKKVEDPVDDKATQVKKE